MKIKLLTLVVSICASSFVYGHGINLDENVKFETDSPIASISLAKQMAGIGLAKKDPLLLLAAAKLYKLVPMHDVSMSKKTDGGVDSTIKIGESEPFNAEVILQAAAEYAGDNDTYLAMISDVQGIQSDGKEVGLARHVDRAHADSADTYNVKFKEDTLAEILVVGDGKTDLDLYIYDDHGNQICREIDKSDTAYCSWVPKWEGSFEVRIRNLGHVSNQYLIFTSN